MALLRDAATADSDSGYDTNASQSACRSPADPRPRWLADVFTSDRVRGFDNKFVASALVIECVAPVSVTVLLELPVPLVHDMQVPQVQVIDKTVEFPFEAHNVGNPRERRDGEVCFT